MNENKVLSFVKRLSSDTANGKISWHRLNDYQNRTEHTPDAITWMLWENEYRHIDYHNSFMTTINSGDIFIIYEDNESGREGGIQSICYKIYLHDECKNEAWNLSCPAHALYQLLNAVRADIAKTESDAEAFIDNYLSQ